MSQNFLPCDRDQQMLLPADMREWLAEDHLAWFVLDAVDEMDLTPFFSNYRDDGWGRAAHDPRDDGRPAALRLRGRRALLAADREASCTEDIAFRVIAANQTPDHATIARFRVAPPRRARRALQRGPRSSAERPAWSRSERSPSTARGSRPTPPTAEPHLRAAGQRDPRGGRRGRRGRGRGVRRQARRRAARRSPHPTPEAARGQAANRRRTRGQAGRDGRLGGGDGRAHPKDRLRPEGTTRRSRGRSRRRRRRRVNVTDPDSKPVKTRHGFIQGYTAQAAADRRPGDRRRRADHRSQRAQPSRADGESRRGGARQGRRRREAKAPARRRRLLQRTADRRASRKRSASALPARRRQRKTPTKMRSGPHFEAMRRRLKEPEAEAAYRRRQQMVEPVFAQIKSRQRAAKFSRRGLSACRAEWRLTAATHNLLKLYTAGLRRQAA